MHPTFKKFSRKPEKVDEIINEDARKAKFSTVFYNLFPPDGKYSLSMQSYLNLLPGFEFKASSRRKSLDDEEIVKELYEKFHLNQETGDGVHQFWVFLVKMYNALIQKSPSDKCDRPNFDNIFAFMNGFPIEDTRVVIIGLDPPYNLQSTGYAFHGSDCPATHELVRNFFNNDFQDLNKMGQTGREPEPSTSTFTKKIFDLEGWIEQGVLLFNTYLSYGHHLKDLWLYFTRFLVKQLSSECDCLVFILACGDASENFSNLIDQEKHKVINVYHPTHRSPKTKEHLKWDIQRPFLQANEYFYRKEKLYMIDWEMVGKNVRMEKYRKYFKLLALNEKEEEEEVEEEQGEEPEVEEEQEEEAEAEVEEEQEEEPEVEEEQVEDEEQEDEEDG